MRAYKNSLSMLLVGVAVVAAPGVNAQSTAPTDQAVQPVSTGTASDDNAPATVSPPAQPVPAKVASSDDIVVTALKRSQNLQNTAATIQVVDQAQLQQAGITSLVNINQVVPSMQLYVSPLGNPALFLYGMGTPATGTTFEQSVMPIVDGVANGHGRALLGSLYDLSSVEVVKGTQSILGKNASLGALSVTTQKPTDRYELLINGGYEFALSSAKTDAAINVPLSQALALRVAGLYSDQGGWVRNQNLDRDWPRTRSVSGRAALSYKPGSNFDYLVTVQFDHRKTDGTAAESLALTPNAGNGQALCALSGTTCDFGSKRNVSYEGNTPWGLPNTETDGFRAIGIGNLDLGGATLTSTTGYVHYKSTTVVDIDQLPVNLFNARIRERDSAFSQELRLNNSDSGPFSWTLGAFHAYDNFSLPIDQRAVSTAVVSAGPPPATLFAVTGSIDFWYKQYTYTSSGFAQAFYRLTDALELGGGLRYSHEVRKADISNTTVTPGLYSSIVMPPFPLTRVRRTNGNLDYSGSIRFTPTNRINLYASYGQGTKSGGFNNQPRPAATQALFQANAEYQEEIAHTLEVGSKFSFGKLGYLNVSAFSVKVDNFQNATSVGPTIIYLTRDQRSRGANVDAVAHPVPGVTLKAQVTYTDTLDTTMNLPLIQAPDWSGIVGAEYGRDVGNLRLTGAVDLNFRSKLWSRQPATLTPTAIDSLYLSPAAQRLNARVSMGAEGGGWTISLIGRNLTNAYIIESAYSATGYTGAAVVPERPRTVALEFTYRM